MISLRDLYRHQAWADARHLNALAAHHAARADDVIRARAVHIYTVQRFFLWMVGDQAQAFALPPPEMTIAQLRPLARTYHDEALRRVDQLDEAELSATAVHPFAPPAAPRMTIGEALTQCAMHSHYHRGQNASRMRELGAEPPMTDLIAWFWSGRELPQWA